MVPIEPLVALMQAYFGHRNIHNTTDTRRSHRIGSALTIFAVVTALTIPAVVTRAREVGRAMPTDLLGPPGRCSGCWPHDGEVAGGAVADSTLVIFRFGATMELRGRRRRQP